MKLICKGYNTCEDRFDCVHAKPHYKYEHICEFNDKNFLAKHNECQCHSKYLRKLKLEKLNESRG